jgi:hypothetical protein
MIAAAGLPFGTRGIATIPAPRRPRVLVDIVDPLRADRADRALGLLSARAVAGGSAALAVAGGSGAPVAGAVPQTSQ